MTKRTILVLAFLCAAGIIWSRVHDVAQETAQRLRRKAAEAQAGVQALVRKGGDPLPILAVMEQVKPSLDADHPEKADALLDQALHMLDEALRRPAAEVSILPVYDKSESPSSLYANPQPVEISGCSGTAMEPFISPDGRYLFFNNDNGAGVNTDLYFAERRGPTRFRCLGELPGVNSASLDAVASLDRQGHFYFTTLRTYDQSLNSIYTGEFDGKRVSNVRVVAGDISPRQPGMVNMDACISPDGQSLYLSRALITPSAPAPKQADLMIARVKDGKFSMDPDSERILKNVNTEALEYAAAITADGKELYFTRASQPRPGTDAAGASVRIMVAMRASVTEPFGEPRVLKALSGFVEGPSVSLDKRELFFHKKVGDKYMIYRALRQAE